MELSSTLKGFKREGEMAIHGSPDIQVHQQDGYNWRRRVEKAVAEGNKDDVQRWTTKRKAALLALLSYPDRFRHI